MGHETGAIRKAKASLIFSMLVFGTIGIFVRYIPLPSSVIALTRGVIGTVFLIVVTLKRGPGISWKAIRRNLLNLCLSGAFIGINWILLFESYRFTTVATATLCYYMAPVFVTISAPFLFKERLTKKKMLCIAGALVGMIFVSGIWNTGISGTGELRGVLYGIGAAVFYASVILLNKKIRDISAYDKTMMQLAAASIVLLPYTVLTEKVSVLSLTPVAVILLAVVGILHTGISYTLYFGSMKELEAQTIAIFSYIDPIVAILLSALFLKEPLGIGGIAGAIMVLGAALISELPDKLQDTGGKEE
ncbi:DMT family transporter [Frisingicoccus sp.]|uniref:DMT family transporter n=1 Tax=Frisingicoccus sp. TaxID=1918627 RepID=UPI00399645C7